MSHTISIKELQNVHWSKRFQCEEIAAAISETEERLVNLRAKLARYQDEVKSVEATIATLGGTVLPAEDESNG